MAENSKIQWTHHTFNPWRGCTKVSEGCKHCYAETMSKRNLKVLGQWGPNGTRVVASESMWREPMKWDAAAKAAGERHRVFCASLADVFEGRDTMLYGVANEAIAAGDSGSVTVGGSGPFGDISWPFSEQVGVNTSADDIAEEDEIIAFALNGKWSINLKACPE